MFVHEQVCCCYNSVICVKYVHCCLNCLCAVLLVRDLMCCLNETEKVCLSTMLCTNCDICMNRNKRISCSIRQSYVLLLCVCVCVCVSERERVDLKRRVYG